MIRIAFCDDDRLMLNKLSGLLEQYRMERSCEMEYLAYQSPLELMAGMERGLRWDILLLDILMPGENGMELAKEIRHYDSHVKIIFLTSSPEFAVQSYTVGAYFYQLKPIEAENLFPVLDRVIHTCEEAKTKKLVLKCKTGISTINPMLLEYCEVSGHSILLHMKNGEILETVGKLNDLEEKLFLLGGFLRVHRSYLVNMAYIQNISHKTVILNSQVSIPIPHGKCSEIKKAYLDYAFEKENVLL